MTGDVFRCGGCGKRNRVVSGAPRSLAKCGSCGKLLFPDEPAIVRVPNGSTATATPPLSHPVTAPRSSLRAKLLWLGFAGLIGWCFFDGLASEGINRPTIGDTLPSALKNLPAIVQTPGIMWNATGRSLEAPLRIETRPGANYYVKERLINGFGFAGMAA